MQEVDVFARIIAEHGPPHHPKKISPDLIADLKNRVPDELLDFWAAYGWGDYKEGYFRLRDPRQFDSLLATIFRGDHEFGAQNLVVIGYTAFNTLRVWDVAGRTILVHLEEAEVFAPPLSSILNPDTGKSYSKAFLAGLVIYDELSLEVQEFYKEACAKVGPPEPDEVFGYAPALQLGGEWGLDHVRRFKAIEYMTFLAQLGPLTVTDFTQPQPGAPLGRIRKVRQLGR